ncbi:protein CREG2 isoform X2 [Anolis carolinensis]|uniref:protein CREG2 isoform X2 n=1 Tax=Anolis carolinensis TaxID=28377 RepID=UPI000462B65E|nr:PREDICTED: protein CREG2 isoform X2 [Anolis carolinensis]|eukprot:XP_008119469.1 PREDICTED: protein CREG2 isoform X2 [Anolis carolinensis]
MPAGSPLRDLACWALLCWALCGDRLARGYVVVSSVSWPEEEELDSASAEEEDDGEGASPALLGQPGRLWKRSHPASVYKHEGQREAGGEGAKRRASASASPSRMFSYRREGAAPPGERAGKAARERLLAATWGFLAAASAHQKIQGIPFGNCLSISDGPTENSTGIPFFYMTPKDNTVADLMKNATASLTVPEAEGDSCRYPVMRKWPRSYEWFFMKMNIEHVWLQNWYGEIAAVGLEEYFKAIPSKA